MNQLCKVCGEPAAGFHFGAFTCEGCKSFFGRTYNNMGTLGECKNNSQCIINKKNRTSCKSCRLKKCLMVGMSKSGSRYGRRSNWFKIHCLIQDRNEVGSHLANRSQLGFTAKDVTSSPSSFKNITDAQMAFSAESSSPQSDASSPLHSRTNYHHDYSPMENSGSSCISALDRKENLLPLSLFPGSPISHFLQRKFLSPVARFYLNRTCSITDSPLLNTGPFCATKHVTSLSVLDPRLSLSPDTAAVASECYADLPQQDKPMDLSVHSDRVSTPHIIIEDDDDETSLASSYINDTTNSDSNSSTEEYSELPLDLTKATCSV